MTFCASDVTPPPNSCHWCGPNLALVYFWSGFDFGLLLSCGLDPRPSKTGLTLALFWPRSVPQAAVLWAVPHPWRAGLWGGGSPPRAGPSLSPAAGHAPSAWPAPPPGRRTGCRAPPWAAAGGGGGGGRGNNMQGPLHGAEEDWPWSLEILNMCQRCLRGSRTLRNVVVLCAFDPLLSYPLLLNP